MSIRISIKMDRVANLAAGRMVGERETVELDPAAFGEDWPAIVAGVVLTGDTATLSGAVLGAFPVLDEPSQAGLIRWIEARKAKLAEEAAAQAERENRQRATVEQWLALPDEDCLVNERHREMAIGLDCDWWARKAWPYPQPADLVPAVEAKGNRLAAVVSLRNEEIMRMIITPAREAAATAAAAAKAKADEVAELAMQMTAKNRLETGVWERETGAYNSKREGAPWCAKVTFPDGPKPVYAWGESTGKWGAPGLLRVHCKPGEIIAWGQKDIRRPDRSHHVIQVMLENGRMKTIDKTEAFRIWQAKGVA